jgi:hypothetical protein
MIRAGGVGNYLEVLRKPNQLNASGGYETGMDRIKKIDSLVHLLIESMNK